MQCSCPCIATYHLCWHQHLIPFPLRTHIPLLNRCFLLKEDALSSKRLFVQPLQCNSLLLTQLCCSAQYFFSLFFFFVSLSLLPSLHLHLQLVLETYNVPELSAGVNCTFEDLSEMDGLVVGSQIQCISPAAKEVPQIITENGEYHTALSSSSLPHPLSLCLSSCLFSKILAYGSLRTGYAKHRGEGYAASDCYSCSTNELNV